MSLFLLTRQNGLEGRYATMTKKLLMNNYPQSTGGVVTKGLYIWLDGQDVVTNTDTFLNNRIDQSYGAYIPHAGIYWLINRVWKYKNYIGYYNEAHHIDKCTVTDEFTLQISYKTFELKGNKVLGIFGPHDDASWNDLNIAIFNKKLRLLMKTVVSDSKEIFTDSMSIDNLAITINNQQKKISLYINGEFKTEVFYRADIDSFFNVSRKWRFQSTRAFQPNFEDIATWRIGSVLMYHRILTEEEIKQNYLYEQSIERGE